MNDGMVVILIGGALAIIGVISLFMAMLAARRVRVMTATKTSKIADLVPAYEAIRAELGGEASEMRQTVELKGHVECDTPLTGELSKKAAAIVHTRVTRDVEVLVRTRDKQGRTQERWDRRSEQVHSTNTEAPFYLNDGTRRP